MSRKPSSKARNARRAAQGKRKPSGPSGAQLAARMVDSVADDVLSGDPLGAELAASWAISQSLEEHWHALALAETEEAEAAVPSAALAPLRLLAQLRDAALRDAALALVYALRALEPDDEAVVEAAADAERRLRFLGAKPPVWALAIDQLELGEPWVVRDVFGDAMTVYVVATHPGWEPHVLGARIEQARFTELVDIILAADPDGLRAHTTEQVATDPEAAMLRVEGWSPARVGTLLWDVLVGVEQSGGDGLSDEGYELFAALAARAALFADAVEAAAGDAASDAELSPHATALDELEYPRLLARFRQSAEYAATDGVDDVVARGVAEWATTQVSGGVARVSPQVAVDLLTDLADSAATVPERALLLQHGIPTVRAWARMCAGLTGLPTEALAMVEEALDEVGDEFAALVRAEPTPQPAPGSLLTP